MTAKIIPAKPAVTITQVVAPAVPEQVQLTISRGAAEALVAVLATVGGHPNRSPRGLTDEVYFGLTNAGIKALGSEGEERLFESLPRIASYSSFVFKDTI